MKVQGSLEAQILEVAKNLEMQILKLDIASLNISDYSKLYWKDNISKLTYIMKCNSYILFNAITKSKKALNEIVLVDNGGGTGSLSLLAKAIGIQTVIYNDIYDVSCNDAKVVASSLGFVANDYVCADADELVNYFTNKNMDCDIVVSRNVIEHIYNLEYYFSNIVQLSKKSIVLCFATTANIKNPLVRIYTQGIQRKAELKGIKGKWEKERDSTLSFLEIRKQIIQESFPNLDEATVATLARKTRGLYKDDILDFVKTSNYSDPFNLLPIDDYNTCDPMTGNRSENLLPVKTYQELVEKNKLQFEVIPGFYNTNYSQKLLNLITPVINILIRNFKPLAIFLAPYIVIVGRRD